jgi:two-component system response regulator HupR/HoxA
MKTLLLVDDDDQVRAVASRILRDEWEVHTACNAQEAANILQGRTFDTVLTDYDMPGENGIWLLGEVRRLNPKARRVLFSGSRPHAVCEHLSSGLVECFVAKPASRAQLLSSLDKPPVA